MFHTICYILKMALFCSSLNCQVRRPYETWFKFFNHSKKETVTPPAFKYKSGMTKHLLLTRILWPAGVIGPFAPSEITLALILAALSAVITFSLAHAPRISHGCSIRGPLVLLSHGWAPLKPVMVPFSSL